jgi:hypothetical protein
MFRYLFLFCFTEFLIHLTQMYALSVQHVREFVLRTLMGWEMEKKLSEI